MDYIKITEEELIVRLQIGQLCIANLTANLLRKIKIGASDSECKLLELQILQNILKYLKCYDVSREDNCISECDLMQMLDYVSSVCKTCYPK